MGCLGQRLRLNAAIGRYFLSVGKRDARVVGEVREWHDEEGWGVLVTPDGLAVWCHFSHLEMEGYRSLAPGARVEFDYEQPGQDGYPARVLTGAKPRR